MRQAFWLLVLVLAICLFYPRAQGQIGGADDSTPPATPPATPATPATPAVPPATPATPATPLTATKLEVAPVGSTPLVGAYANLDYGGKLVLTSGPKQDGFIDFHDTSDNRITYLMGDAKNSAVRFNDNLTVKNTLTAQQLCIGSTCINADHLKVLLGQSPVTVTSNDGSCLRLGGGIVGYDKCADKSSSDYTNRNLFYIKSG